MMKKLPKPVTKNSRVKLRSLSFGLILMSVLYCGMQAGAQTAPPPTGTITVSGIVYADDGHPLPGVSVYIPRSSRGAVSDSKGAYALTVPADTKVLEFSFVGFKTYTLELKGENRTVNITLEQVTNVLDNVVVLGSFQKPVESFTGSVTTITAKELTMYGNRDLLTTIRNIDPAFNLIENNQWGSDPNRIPEITLRGTSSIPNVNELTDEVRAQLNMPLIMIDGFESSVQALMNINQDVIAFINVLKDAAATSLFGSRGSNGVILVETKAPLPGKLRLSVTYTGGVDMPDLTSYSLLNARDKLELEFKVGKFDNARAESDLPLKRYYYYLLDQVNQGVDTDWLSKPLRTAMRNEASVRAEGGDQAFRYAVTLGINNKQGVMKGDKNNNFNADIQLTYNYKTLRFVNNFSINSNNAKDSPYGTFSDYANMNQYFNPYDADGNLLRTVGVDPNNSYGVNLRWGTSTGVANPLYNATLSSFNESEATTLNNNFSLTWNITSDLNLKLKMGVNKSMRKTDIFVSPEHTSFINYAEEDLLRKGTYNITQNDAISYNGTATLDYTRTFNDKHTVTGMLNYDISDKSTDYYNFAAEGFTNPDMSFIGSALQYAKGGKPSGNLTKTRSVGFNGNASYIYDGRYTVEGSARYDGSSLYGSDKRFGFFWSAGAAWLLSKEEFLQGNSFVNRLRLFTNAGTTGSNKFSPYQAMTTYRYYTDMRYYSWMGAQLMGIGNPDLQWEKKMEYSVGLDSEFLDNRLKLRFNLYKNITNSLLSSIDTPTHTGFASYTENAGKIQNTGLELYFTAEIIRDLANGINWTISPSLVSNKNKVLKLSQAMKDAQAVSMLTATTTPRTYYIEGYSDRTIWAVRSLGIDPSTGKEAYIDRFGNVTFVYNPLDMVAVGCKEPKIQGNINSYFRWKDFAFTVTFRYRYGGQQYNETLMNKVENTNYNGNVDSRVYTDRWQQPGDVTFFKSIYVTTATYVTSRFVQDENTFECANIRAEYTFRDLKKSIGFENVRVNIGMADVFRISSIKRERGTYYPFSRTITFGFNALF